MRETSRRRRELGELERAVLDRLWESGPADVKAMHAAVGEVRGLASNTIQSTLERLFRKGLASRRKVGRAYRYEARLSREDWIAEEIREVLARARDPEARVAMVAFVDVAARVGEAQLDALERLVRARRRRTRRDEP